jgi:hypothetical protein
MRQHPASQDVRRLKDLALPRTRGADARRARGYLPAIRLPARCRPRRNRAKLNIIRSSWYTSPRLSNCRGAVWLNVLDRAPHWTHAGRRSSARSGVPQCPSPIRHAPKPRRHEVGAAQARRPCIGSWAQSSHPRSKGIVEHRPKLELTRIMRFEGDDLLLLVGPTMSLEGLAFVLRWRDAAHEGIQRDRPRADRDYC